MSMQKMTKELFNKKYGKWIDKMYKDHLYPFVVLSNRDIAEYIGVTPEQVGYYFKKGFLNRDKDFRQLFNDTRDMSISSIAEYIEKSYTFVRRHYIRLYGENKFNKKQREFSCKNRVKDVIKVGRKEGYIRYKYQRLLKFLYTYKSITTTKLNDMFGSKRVYYSLFKTLKQKGYDIKVEQIDRYEFKYTLNKNNK